MRLAYWIWGGGALAGVLGLAAFAAVLGAAYQASERPISPTIHLQAAFLTWAAGDCIFNAARKAKDE